MYKIADGNHASSDIAYLFSEISAIYPITPSSTMASNVDILTKKETNLFNESVTIIEMQSEAGAAGTLHGSLITGSLSSTFTASQGLLLMIPNMYKIAGEMLPGVMHVAARSLATHALSIFGDHQDIYSARQTGFCMLSSTNVYDSQNLAAVAHLSAIDGSLPFMHFFDGFRTSHEINKIKEMDKEKLKKLINYDKVYEFKNRMLKINAKKQMGMAENEDIYFQSMEAKNSIYNQMPDIVNSNMQKINKLMGTNYKPFNYYGSSEATNIIIAMGSVNDTIKLVVEDLNKKGNKVGLIEVHLYRPFSSKYLIKEIPSTVKNIAVLDRTKEQGSIGEPLYLDVIAALKDLDINIVGGRYGLSSKNTTDQDIYIVFKMLETKLKNNFTISIVDDVTYTSLDNYEYNIELDNEEILIYGFGSDGMVSASKDILKIIGEDKFVQGYFKYDSKKSGGVTISNLRLSDTPINAPYYVKNPKLVVVTKESYLFNYDILKGIKQNGIVLLNTIKKEEELNEYLPDDIKNTIIDKKIKLLIINADQIAIDNNIKGKISKIMEAIILDILKVNNFKEILKVNIENKFKTKGTEIINSNLNSVNEGINKVIEVKCKLTSKNLPKVKLNTIEKINKLQGDDLTVSDILSYHKGEFPTELTKYEKRNIANLVPKWIKENCIQCGQCSLVCPHGAIRSFVTKEDKGNPLLGNKEYNYLICTSEADCTSCGLCINTCPGLRGKKALEFTTPTKEAQEEADYYFNHHMNDEVMDKFTIKGSQLCNPKFEFSGACAGCGETSYIKLLTQLFGNKIIIANATGCSSIYGGSAPSTPYSIPWANSLFEDNAEFMYGMNASLKKSRERIINIINNSRKKVSDEVNNLFDEYLDNLNDYEITNNIKNKLSKLEIPQELNNLLDYMPAFSTWAIGGDGWAYDIGFGGLDHVLSSNENINVLVLDTEVYSNTGGQASKSSRVGAVAQFAGFGKRTNKKDMFRIAMSYPNCYVAQVSLGSNMFQTIKAFKEAEAHNGPSIIIAYSPCIEHGIKGGMSNSIDEQKLAVDCGYLTLMRYNPTNKEFKIDSKEPNFDKYEEFLLNENRYNSLKLKNKEQAEELLNINKNNAINKYNYYKKLNDKE